MPFGTQRVQPFGVVAQKRRQEVEEEEILLSAACPSTKPSSLLAPHAPFALASHDAWNSHAAHHTIASEFCCYLNFPIHHQGIRL